MTHSGPFQPVLFCDSVIIANQLDVHVSFYYIAGLFHCAASVKTVMKDIFKGKFEKALLFLF